MTTTLINATNKYIQIVESLVLVDPTGRTVRGYRPVITLSARATKIVEERCFRHNDGQVVSLLKICCEGQVSDPKICCAGTYAGKRALMANDFIASRSITITQDPVDSQFVANI